MQSFIVILLLLGYTIFFLADRKKALLTLFLLKLPVDQIAWQIPVVSLGSRTLVASEVITVGITLLCLTTFSQGASLPRFTASPIVIFLCAFLLQVFREPSLAWGARLFFQMTTGIFVGIAVAENFRTEEDINSLIRSMLLGTAIVAVLDVSVVFSGGQLQVYAPTRDNTLVGTYLAGGVGNYYSADSFAHGLLVNVPVILSGALLLKRRWEKVLCWCVILFVVIGVFASALRAAWISLTLLLFLWMVLQKRWKLLVATVSCIALILTMQLLTSPLQKAYQRIAFEVESIRRGELPANAFGGRPRNWKIYGDYYLNAPILTQVAGSNEYLVKAAPKVGHDPHNDFLYILLRMGVIGLGITLYLYLVMGINLFRTWRRIGTRYGANLAVTGLLALLSMLIPSFTRTGLMNPNYEWVFWSFALLAFNQGWQYFTADFEENEEV